MDIVLENYLNSICCEEIVEPFNFDVTANWAGSSYPVTDQASFEAFLSERSGGNDPCDLTNIVVTNFELVGDTLRCNLTADGTSLDLGYMGISETENFAIGNINGLKYIYFEQNPMTDFNAITPLPNGLLILDFYNSGLRRITSQTTFPTSLTSLSFISCEFDLNGYIESEVWANAQPAFTNVCNVSFNNNIDSVAGTNLEAILISKNCTVIA
jgi:hypothetical protein